ncbi:MAG TPA: Hsp20/alpha crystallin family protein [Solirubrobacteraceae bacterium]|jgi:HSP20 family protein|nr:Hsp20/alpha crystallin family protein [Solirubrobacteraceae bacterium]
MAIIRWAPASEIQTVQQEMNRLFGTFFDSPTAAAARRWVPAMDLVEDGEEYVLRADLPGLTAEDVKLEVENDRLTLSGERRSESRESNDGYQRIERRSGSFTRSVALPEGVDPESIEATFENGVLELRIPKPAEQKPQRVEIQVGAKQRAQSAS